MAMKLQLHGGTDLQVAEATFGMDFNEALVHHVLVDLGGRQGGQFLNGVPVQPHFLAEFYCL